MTKSDRFRFAWIGAADDGDGHLDPVARSGPDRGYLDSIASSFDDGVEEPEPSYAAFQTGDATVVSNVAETLRSGQWRKEAFSREFQSVISVPLQYGDVTYGVLSVYAGQPGVFDEMEQSVFAELGETIANAINAVETKRALLSGRRVELEFRLRDASTSVLGRLAGALDAEVEYRGGIPLSGERVRTFFDVHDATPEQIRDALDESVAVESGQVIGGTDDGHLVEAVVSDSTAVRALTEYGASIRSLTVTEDGMALTVDVPTSVDVRDFVEWFQHRYESAEFVARRERERAPETRDGLYAEVEEYLTDRQLEVLETAYYSGFFVSPRQSTGSDVADLLGVSQPTVSEQLRAAQCKVLTFSSTRGRPATNRPPATQ
ncbi:bacterio-opsin activator domain-containing protein [Halospeciosus flavus]|uniref:bacterio-opsin activator domain-containing protein n=1 Tax=Halospeciosus flavus TaxID=3032283 RepID=UPI00360E8EDB